MRVEVMRSSIHLIETGEYYWKEMEYEELDPGDLARFIGSEKLYACLENSKYYLNNGNSHIKLQYVGAVGKPRSDEYYAFNMWHIRDDALWSIIPARSGITWSQQAGGTCCRHPEVEGYSVKIEGTLALPADKDPLYNNVNCDADMTKEWLQALGIADSFEADALSMEAWVPVVSRHGVCTIFTYENSD